MAEIAESTEVDALKQYCNQWFIPQCCWNIPDLQQTEQQDIDRKKALITKGVIGLRQCMENNNAAVKAFAANEVAVIRAQLEVIALKYGYVPEETTESINLDYKRAVEAYKKHHAVLNTLNTNMGGRVTACVLLCAHETATEGRNDLKVLALLKRFENTLLQGSVKCGVLKTAILMSRELSRPKYAPVVQSLTVEVTNAKQKLYAALARVPAGVTGDKPVKVQLDHELKAISAVEDDAIQAIRSFELFSSLYGDINTALSTRLAALAVPVELEHNIMTVVPKH